MSLLSRQQATQNWHESDPGVHFGDLLETLGMYKDIATDHGLNFSAHQSWRFGDPHKKSGVPDQHDYEIKQIDSEEVLPGSKWKNLFRWLVSQAHEFHDYDTVYLVTDNRDLVAGSLTEVPGLNHWPMVAAWWKEKIKYIGPYSERTTVVFVPVNSDSGLEGVHPTWAGTYILDACVYMFPATNFAFIDSDCVPVTLFEIQELWRSCEFTPCYTEDAGMADLQPISPIAPAHKRAGSVDTGRAQQHGPPTKLSKSRSVENVAIATGPLPFPGSPDNLAEQVDYGGSDPPSPSTPANRDDTSESSSQAAASEWVFLNPAFLFGAWQEIEGQRSLMRLSESSADFLPPRWFPCQGPYYRDNLLELAGHGDGHILAVTVALLLAVLTGSWDSSQIEDTNLIPQNKNFGLTKISRVFFQI